jgi:ABC-2 type transport system ATP-binding protein
MQEVELFVIVIIINNGKIVTDKKLDNLISEDKNKSLKWNLIFKSKNNWFLKLKILFRM